MRGNWAAELSLPPKTSLARVRGAPLAGRVRIIFANPANKGYAPTMTAGCRTSAGLKLFVVAGVLGALTLRVALAQAAVGGSSLPDIPREVVLRPEVAPSELEGVDQSLAHPNKPFLKEPATSQHHVFRKLLHIGQDTNNAIAVIWDQPGQKLYLDLNRNLDLTDDANGVFSATNKGFQQTFPNVTVSVKTAAGVQPVMLDLHCYTDANANWASAHLGSRSLWQAKVTVAGQDWQVAALDGLLGQVGPTTDKFLLLRPWAARTNHVSLYDPSSGIVPFPGRLFWLGQAFQLERHFDTGSATPVCKLEFIPQQPTLTELRVSGEFVYYTVLRDTNGYTAVLREPQGTVQVPQGVYEVSAAWLKKGAAEAFQQTYQPMVIKAATATNLILGGPLTNWVVLERVGRKLQMNYQLQGADGMYYQMAGQDRERPPEFTVYYGGKKALVGKFEFG